MLVWVPEPVCQPAGEMVVEPAVGNVLRRPRPLRRGALAVERAEIAVGTLGRGTLDQPKRMHEFDRHALGADAKIMQRVLGLRAPELVGGDFQRTEGIALAGGFCPRFCSQSFADRFSGHTRQLPCAKRASLPQG